ncbi:MAG: RNA 2'-phosphotransferase [Deltaproteobacteria bacterium]|nr:RNA 2'-phosphotransferase [Deltaproteobacteria bacterium]
MMGEAEVGEDRKTRLLRFLIMCLKERADAFGMRPDREGYVSLMDLMGAILDEPDFSWVTVNDVEAAVESSKPRIFEIRGRRIRVLGAGRGGDGKSRRRRRKPRKQKPRPEAGTQQAHGNAAGGQQASSDQPAGKKKRRRRRRKKKPQADQPKPH